MTKSHLDGDIDEVSYGLDFPYGGKTRYKELLKENKELAKIIYDCLVEDGAYLYDDLTEEMFKEKVWIYKWDLSRECWFNLAGIIIINDHQQTPVINVKNNI